MGLSLRQPLFFCAFRADSFHDIVHFAYAEALGNLHGRNHVIVQAIGFLAFLAIEVAMLLFRLAVPVIVAEAELVGAAPVVHTVDEVVVVEEVAVAEEAVVVPVEEATHLILW